MNIEVISGGKDFTSYLQNVCKCGWRGKKHYAYNDYWHSNCDEEGKNHKRKQCRPQRGDV